jgi:hypothetical protein
MNIQLETIRYPFSIAFKKNNILLMTVRIDSDSEPDLHTDSSSVTATFPRFTLNLNLLADQWTLTTSPADSPVQFSIELPGHWYGHGELINQHWPLNRIMLQSAPLHTFDNGPTGLSGVMNPAWFSSNGALIIADSPVEVGINQPPTDYPHYKWSFSSEGRGPFEDRPFYDPDLLGDGLFTFKGNTLDLKFSFSENALTA